MTKAELGVGNDQLGVSEEFARYMEGFMIGSRGQKPMFYYYQAVNKFGPLSLPELCYIAVKFGLKPGWIYYKLKDLGRVDEYEDGRVEELMSGLKHFTSEAYRQAYHPNR